jgi:aspartate/methionine/tyrosine aminotransferase
MREENRPKSSEYLHWAKTQTPVRWNLMLSGILPYSIKELGIELDDVEINGPSTYGYEPLQKALAFKCAVDPDCVAAATGTSMANYLVMATLLEAGDEVLIEQPTYEPLLAVANYLGARVLRFERRFENGFQIDIDEIRKIASPHTRLIVITNPHNPTGAFCENEILKQIGAIAREIGASVLVDEVYLECMFPRSGTPYSAFHLGQDFVITSSLTKAYGLNGLRCGWILAKPEIIRKIWRLNDLFGVIPAHPAERLSVIALAKLPEIAERARNLLNTNRRLLDEFLDRESEVDVLRPPFGTIVFPRFKRGQDSLTFCRELREKYETAVVPGHYFEMPNHFRLGIGCATDVLAGGLENLRHALATLS